MLEKMIKFWKNSRTLKLIGKIENAYFRKKATNTDFTLLTPNCMAGLIYSRLNENFNSPTINTSIDTKDFIKFLNNLDYYLSQDVVPFKVDDATYPVGKICGENPQDDIRINFVHYDDFQQAREKWNQRKKRVNKDNMYVIMCDVDDIYQSDYNKVGFVSDEDLRIFENFKCNNKALLTRNTQRNQKYAYYIKPNYNRVYPLTYLNRDVLGLNGFEKHFDFVSFLNKK